MADERHGAMAPPNRIQQAWAVMREVPDPEVPALSLWDLGVVRDILAHDDGMLELVLTPTYSGCPATEVIEADARQALERAGLGPVRVTLRRAPAWSTDWISEQGHAKLREYGIAPPGPVDPAIGIPIRLHRSKPLQPMCPRCDSPRTERLSAFGSTACKALYRCVDCREPFEYFKPI